MKNLLKCLPLLLALTACKDETLTDVVVKEPPDLAVIATWNSTLAPVGPMPQASGALELDETGSYMLLDLTAQGLDPDSTYSWHLFFGSCGNRLARVGADANPSAYKRFTADANGAGTSEGTVAGRLKADSTYSLHLFVVRPLDDPEDTTFYACGNLQRK